MSVTGRPGVGDPPGSGNGLATVGSASPADGPCDVLVASSSDGVTAAEARRTKVAGRSGRSHRQRDSDRVEGATSQSDGDDAGAGAPLLEEAPRGGERAERGLAFLRAKWAAITSGALGEQLYIALVVLFFASSSLGAIFINKTCLTGYHFRYPLVLMLGQMLFAIVVLTALHATGCKTIPTMRRKDIPLMAIPTVLFTSNVIVGLSALSLVNIPMFSAFRRLTLLFVMGAEYVFLRKTHSPAIINAVVVMTFGAFVSAVDDVTFSRLGYLLVFLNNLLTALYLAAIKRVMRETLFDPLSLLYYTALMGAPVVAALIVLTGELRDVVNAFKTQPELMTPGFLMSLTLTATGAFAVNFSTSLCTHVTSPLTTSVAGQVKNVLQTVLGFFSWGFVPTTMNVAGLLVALGAQLVFATLKYRENCSDGGKASAPPSPAAATRR
jgi:drug/metabolite transporter (DMT)-like permease